MKIQIKRLKSVFECAVQGVKVFSERAIFELFFVLISVLKCTPTYVSRYTLRLSALRKLLIKQVCTDQSTVSHLSAALHNQCYAYR